MSEKIINTTRFIRSITGGFDPEVGIILGTGLGGLVENIDITHSINYADIDGFPVSTVEGHSGRFIFGNLGGRRVMVMQGRFHYYEGYTPQQVVFPVRVMRQMGIGTLFVSNAAGGVNPGFSIGDIMVIDDHINLIPNPLVGPNDPLLGPRFPDMSEAYSKRFIARAREQAGKLGIQLKQGCYISTTGPTFETPKEYGYFRIIGGDAVGMSTTPEVIAARHMSMEVFAVSVITDLGGPGRADSVSHEEVMAVGRRAEKEMSRLFIAMLEVV